MDQRRSKRLQIKDNRSNLKFLEGIMTDIFLRLPVRSIMKCKTAFGYWKQFIDNRYFIDTKLSSSKENSVCIICPYTHANKDVYLMDRDWVITERITLSGCEGSSYLRMICSYNGLICCISNTSSSSNVVDLNIFICNPATQEVLLLPKPSPARNKCSIGLVFEPATTEYKVFWFFKRGSRSFNAQYDLEIYSSVTRSWKKVGCVDKFPMPSLSRKCCPLSSDHVCIDGTTYWLMSSEENPLVPSSILAVDMAESFTTIDLPEDATVTEHSFLAKLDDFLALVVVDDVTKNLDTFLMFTGDFIWQEEGSHSIPFRDSRQCYYSVAILEHDLLLSTSSCFLVLNLENGIWSELDIDDDHVKYSSAMFEFAESLMPCDGRVRD